MWRRIISQVSRLGLFWLPLATLAVVYVMRPIDAAQALFAAGFLITAGRVTQLVTRQNQRSRCLSTFVSPNVARLVAQRGPDFFKQDCDREITIVCADVRNFTHFAANVESAQVMLFLREYYDAVGAVVAAYGGTIKDYAGDGILVLMGAPRAVEDHAARGLDMAVDMREAALEVTSRWSSDTLTLGIGVGVASGIVTVGVVGGTQRREYAAVGPAVNLAARLCSKAHMSEVLVDDDTLVLAREQKCNVPAQSRTALNLKGFEQAVSVTCC